jgi:hypothetical protein
MFQGKTGVEKKTLNPVWNEEFRFEVSDDTLLQNEPLIFKVWDSDNYKADSCVGMVYVDLNPLLMRAAAKTALEDRSDEDDENEKLKVGSEGNEKISPSKDNEQNVLALVKKESFVDQQETEDDQEELTIDGLFPIYDTLAGVRGELNLSIKLQFFGDLNPFRDSSAGVQLFPLSMIDEGSGWEVSHVFGFVEELGVADDPEYEWKDQFRQARYR